MMLETDENEVEIGEMAIWMDQAHTIIRTTLSSSQPLTDEPTCVKGKLVTSRSSGWAAVRLPAMQNPRHTCVLLHGVD